MKTQELFLILHQLEELYIVENDILGKIMDSSVALNNQNYSINRIQYKILNHYKNILKIYELFVATK